MVILTDNVVDALVVIMNAIGGRLVIFDVSCWLSLVVQNVHTLQC